MAIYRGAVQIGPIIFENFGIPESIKFGGPEHLVIHKQPGGARQIDVMGDDPGPIEWSGLLLQDDAHTVVQDLQNLKVAGNPVDAIWSGSTDGGAQFENFVQAVVIEDVSFVFRSAHMIEYHIKCVPIINGAGVAANPAPNLNANIPGGV